MTTFETQVYDKDDGNIVGAQVIVSSEGDIDSIDIVDKTALDALVAQLDVLDETYVQFEDDSSLAGSTIDELLENTEENVPINATTLSGFASDAFSKTGHTHTKADITNLLSYHIAADTYNVDIGDEVNITVTVTDTLNRPVANSPVVINLNGAVIASGNTNSSGVFSYTYTTTDYGIFNFSVNTQNIQIQVKNQTLLSKTIVTGKIWVYYNPELKLAHLIINGTFSMGASGDIITMTTHRPKSTIPLAVYTTELNISMSDTGKIHYVNNSGSNGNKNVVASATYFYD